MIFIVRFKDYVPACLFISKLQFFFIVTLLVGKVTIKIYLIILIQLIVDILQAIKRQHANTFPHNTKYRHETSHVCP